jgi:hypothetical protein
VSYTAITLCVASQRVFIVIIVISLSTQSGNFLTHPPTLSSSSLCSLRQHPRPSSLLGSNLLLSNSFPYFAKYTLHWQVLETVYEETCRCPVPANNRFVSVMYEPQHIWEIQGVKERISRIQMHKPNLWHFYVLKREKGKLRAFHNKATRLCGPTNADLTGR